MADFNPSPHDRLTIGGFNYQVMPHPAVPTFAFGQEGRKAFVFQLSGGPDHGLYALKKFKKAFRLPELVEINDKLARFAQWPGLEVCNRICLHQGKHADILNQYADLEFAVLMPWISGSTWYDMVIGMTPLTRLEALAYANATAQVLAALEEAGLAHCDISAANVIINPNTNRAHLIDVEDLYAPGFNPPASMPAGTDGYAHQQVRNGGYWGPHADRFSGAVIICEMAAWHVPEIRKQAEEEHYFADDEMQQDNEHYRLMRQVLHDISPKLADLFEAAWFSDTLADAPPLKAWQEVISEAYQRENVARVAPEWRSLTIPGLVEQEEPPQPRPALNVEPPAPAPPTEAEEPEAQPQPEQEPAPQPGVVQATTPPAPPSPLPSAAQRAAPAPASPQTPTPASRPIQVQTSPQTGGPVIEWRPLDIPKPAESASPRNGWGSRPIMPQVEQAQPEEPEEPEPAPDPPAEAREDVLPAPAAEEPFEAANEADSPAPVEMIEPEESGPEYEPALYDEPSLEDELAVYGDEIDYEDEPEAPAGATEEDRAYQAGLLKPLLDLTHIDDRNRPHLVWTESPGAEVYVLQEDDNPHFRAPKEYTVRGRNDTRWSPPPWPLWRRTGRLYYRLRAEGANGVGPWSDVLQVRIGRG